jgi:hypothetical protein
MMATNAINTNLEIVNNGSTPVDYTTLKIRYYFAKEGCTESNLTFECDYGEYIASGGATQVSLKSSISGVFATDSTTTMGADEYLEISISPTDAGTKNLSTGDNVTISGRIHAKDYSCNFTPSKEYSFDSTKTSYQPWSNVTLYQSGTLVWGTVP